MRLSGAGIGIPANCAMLIRARSASASLEACGTKNFTLRLSTTHNVPLVALHGTHSRLSTHARRCAA